MSATDLINRLHRARGNLADSGLSRRALFVLGCQRSGTTLLYMLLTSHPDVFGRDERDVHTGYPLDSELKNVGSGSYLCYKIPTRTGELDTFQKGFSDATFAWIIRNPYATISSMKSLILEDGSTWLETSGIKEIRTLSALFANLRRLKLENLSPAQIGAYIWKYKIKAYERYQKHFPVHLIRYEDLVLDTQHCLTPLLESLKLHWHEDILDHPKIHKDSLFWGNNRGDQPIDASRVHPKLNLEMEEIQDIAQIIQTEQNQYYPAATELNAGIGLLRSLL